MKDNTAYPLRIWLVHFRGEGDLIQSIIKRIFRGEAIIKQTENEIYVSVDSEDITALEMVEILESEAMTTVRIAVGPVCNDQTLANASIDVVKNLLHVGQTLDRSKNVFYFEAYQMADYVMNGTLHTPFALLDDEVLLYTAKVFLESNLNVTDAAGKLYVHRNTLLYRLSKIQSTTGYDLRNFIDASNFYFLMQADKIHKIAP